MKARFLAAALTLVFGVLSTGPVLAAGGLYGNLSGIVSDAQTHAPIADAAVTATSPSGTYHSTTDSRGRYSILGMNVDTYTVSVSAKGYEPSNVTGVIVFGDENAVANVVMAKQLSTIARTTSVAANSAFQPTQTVDSYTVSGQRVQQALGNAYDTNESALLQSVPGVIQTYDSTNGAGLSVRGSLAVELGYQYDGVPFSAPFFNAAGSQGFLNGINGGSGGNIQVVSGAGDATQGNVGGGIINTVVPRGTFPSSGTADFEVGGPWYDHTFNGDYAAATPNGRFADYMSFSASSYVPSAGPVNVPTAELGAYFGTSFARHNDFVNNFTYRFGKNNHESLQILTRVGFLDTYNGLGGLAGLSTFPNNQAFLNEDPFGIGLPYSTAFGGNANYLLSLIPQLPYNQNSATVIQPELTNANPVHFVKIGYTNEIDRNTFANLSYYNWGIFQGGSNYSNYQNAGDFATGWNVVGGTRTGGLLTITHALGENNTLSIGAKYEDARPYWDSQTPGTDVFGLYLASLGAFGGPASPNSEDWALPSDPSRVSGPGNPCNAPIPLQSACYIHDALVTAGKWNGTMPQIPTFGIGYHGTIQQNYGVGLRDQWQLGDKLNLDFGVRWDAENNKFGPNEFSSPGGTPSDVAPSKVIGPFSNPHVIQPRIAASYRLDRDDSLRFSYAFSTLFFFGQTLGTPFNVTGLSPLLYAIPAKSSSALYNNGNPNYCGSGTHGPGAGYTANPDVPSSPANGGQPAYLYPCASYADSVGWFYDQNFDAPDLGGYGPPTYANYDLAWSHLFDKGRLQGWSSRVTLYTRRGFNVEQNVLLLNGPPNPITGQSSASVFTTTPNGNEKTFGIEAQLTTPDVRPGQKGLSGFITFDYINELLNTPPVAGSSALPILQGQLLQTGQLFKAGFVPPLSAVIGATYHFKSGVTITPTLFVNGGYPFGVGRQSIGYVNGVLMTLPETNYGPNVPYAGIGGPLNAYNASYYVDPQVPGSILNPNVAGSRGYDEPAIAGLKNSPAQAYLNLTLEAPLSKRVTAGFEAFNVLDNHYGVPVVNTQYQPVGFGIAGPDTGQLASAYANPPVTGAGNEYYPGGSTLPFLNNYGVGTTWTFYLRIH